MKLIMIIKIVILGDMFELGAASEKEHQNIVDLCDTLELKPMCFCWQTLQ